MSEPKKVRVNKVYPLSEGQELELHDLQISASDAQGLIHMIDMTVVEEEVKKHNENYEIKPGIWRITPKDGLMPLDLPEETFFETDTSRSLIHRFNSFKKKLDVYEKYGITKKRAILMGSDPGTGKSSTIRYFSRQIRNEEGLCILQIDNEDVNWEIIISMFIRSTAESAKFIVLVIEDIGGAGLHERRADVPSTLLNFLDGNSDCFKIPVLIVATTNFINEIGGQLTDRPGRFDVVMQVEPPKDEEIQFLVESFLKRTLTDTEKKAVLGKKFTPAYAREALIRAELEDIDIETAVKQLVKQRDRSRNRKHGEKRGSMGFVPDNDED